jgi:hypothetical protein
MMSLWQRIETPQTIESTAFFEAIETNEEGHFLQASDVGLLEAFVPEWQRMRGQANTQHQTHDFTLDVHTAKVVTKTRQTPAFKSLPPHWQRLTTLAAFFHDLSKQGGYAFQRFELSPDPLHPLKVSAEIKRYLGRWGFSMLDVFIVVQLVRYHQVFGRWIIRENKTGQAPTSEIVYAQAMTLPSSDFLNALLALTEGDIRSVKAHDAIFDARVEAHLLKHAKHVQTCIEDIHAKQNDFIHHYLPLEVDASTGLPMVRIALPEAMINAYDTSCDCGLEALASWMLFPIEGLGTGAKVFTAEALAYFIKPYSPHAKPVVQRLSTREWQAFWEAPLHLESETLGTLNPFLYHLKD